MSVRINYPESVNVHYKSFRYPAGEVQVRLFPETVELLKEHKSVQVVARITNGDLIELAMLMDAIDGIMDKVYSVEDYMNDPQTARNEMVLILPYLPYARADRRFTEGDCNGLATAAGIIQSAMMFSRLITIDAHSPQTQEYLSDIEDISPLPVIQWATNLIRYTTKEPVTLLLPDEGSKSRYDLSSIGMPVLQCSKKRNPATGELSGFTVPDDIHTRNVLIVDDLCDGGRTFLGIADELEKQYVNRGLRKFLYVTHGVFSQGFTELKKRFQMIYTTDSFKTWPKEDCSTFPIETLISKHLDGDTKQEHENQAPIVTCSDVDVPLA